MWLQCGFSLKTHLVSWLRGQGEERDRERRREGRREGEVARTKMNVR